MKLNELITEDDDPCWDGYQQVGMKTKNGKEVPNCVPEEDEEMKSSKSKSKKKKNKKEM